jgi:chromate transporter
VHREIVDVRRWLSEEEFLAGFALGQIFPGVNSTNLTIYAGQHLRGAPGAAVALCGLLSGPFVIVMVAALLYRRRLLAIPGALAAMAGVAAVVVGMLLQLGTVFARRIRPRLPSSAVCLLVARVWNPYCGRPWHQALEQGLAPIGVGLMFAEVIAVLRLGTAGRALALVMGGRCGRRGALDDAPVAASFHAACRRRAAVRRCPGPGWPITLRDGARELPALPSQNVY